MDLVISELNLPLLHPFTIARGSETTAHNLLFRVRHRGLEGLGETAPTPRYDESTASVAAYFESHPPLGDDPYALETLLEEIPPAARCGLDLALHDLIGKDLDRPLWRLFGLSENDAPPEYPASKDLNPDVLTARKELRAVLSAAMKTLPERYQTVIGLYYLGGKTMREIGDALGINESRVSQIHRAALDRMQLSLQATGIHSSESLV